MKVAKSTTDQWLQKSIKQLLNTYKILQDSAQGTLCSDNSLGHHAFGHLCCVPNYKHPDRTGEARAALQGPGDAIGFSMFFHMHWFCPRFSVDWCWTSAPVSVHEFSRIGRLHVQDRKISFFVGWCGRGRWSTPVFSCIQVIQGMKRVSFTKFSPEAEFDKFLQIEAEFSKVYIDLDR